MRLTAEQIATIRQTAAEIFGADARVWLFGSRVDDAGRGGDIDLHIEAEGSLAELLDRELTLYARLIRRLGERRIDIVVQPRGTAPRPIDEQARRHGVPL